MNSSAMRLSVGEGEWSPRNGVGCLGTSNDVPDASVGDE